MFLRGPVPVHLKFVVAYCKNLGKCLIFFCSTSPWQPLRIREHRGDACSEDAKVTLSPLQVSGHALLSLPSQTCGSASKYWMPFRERALLLLLRPDLWVSRQILNAFPWACIALTPAARLVFPVSLLYGRLRPTSCWKIYQCQSHPYVHWKNSNVCRLSLI